MAEYSKRAVKVLEVALEAYPEGTYLTEVCQKTGINSGSATLILRDLEGAGLLDAHWKEIDPGAGRPARRRRFYVLTEDGRRIAPREIAKLNSNEKARRPLGKPAPAQTVVL